MRARVGAVSALVVVVLAAPFALLGPVARAKAQGRAAKRGISLEIGRVRPGRAGIWLLDVALHSREGRVSGKLGAVLVPYGDGPIEVHGGDLTVRGTPDELERELRGEGSTERTNGRRLVRVDGLSATLTAFDQRGTRMQAWGLGLTRDTEGDRVTVDLAEATTPGAASSVRGAEATLGARGGAHVRRMHVRDADLSLDLDALRRRDGAPLGNGDGAAPPAAAPGTTNATSEGHSHSGLALVLPVVAALAQQRLPDGAAFAVDSARVRLAYRGEHLGFGPSRVAVRRLADALTLEVTPNEGAAPGSTPLSLRGKLPFAGDPPSVEIEGGPLSLAALGVRDGELGLTHTREATLEAHLRLELAGGALRASGNGGLANVSFRRPEVSAREVRGLKLAFRADGEFALDGSRVHLADSEVSVGDVKFAGTIDFERDAAGTRLRAAGGIPLAACSSVVTSIPEALLADAPGLTLEGTFALDHALSYDSAHPEKLALTLHVENGCHVTASPAELSPERFRGIFSREVKGPDGLPMTIRTGPGAPGWIRYDDLPRTIEIAVLVCEDGSFFRHRGFDFRAIEMALKDDIRAGRFVRGASTISMQLAKNLYLSKEKTLSRKVEEALLTMLLEAKLSKNDLLEIYLNIVELGPGIYGIDQAADYYFDESGKELTLAQALYLASILPDPTRTHFEPDGHISPRWGEYIKKLMRIARGVNRITDEELEAGLAEELAFRKGSGPGRLRELGGGSNDGIDGMPYDDDAARP